MASKAITFRARSLAADLDGRGGQDVATVRRCLERYFHALRAELAGVDLTEAEASLVVDACNGVLFEGHSIPLLWAEVDNTIRRDGVDSPGLVEELRSLTYTQALAVVDAAARYWTAQGEHAERLRAVGLVGNS